MYGFMNDTGERFFTLTLPCEDFQNSYYVLVMRNHITGDETTDQADYQGLFIAGRRVAVL